MEKQPAPCRVRITKCSSRTWWYKTLIGEEFETDQPAEGRDYVVWEDKQSGHLGVWRHIKYDDCEVIKTN